MYRSSILVSVLLASVCFAGVACSDATEGTEAPDGDEASSGAPSTPGASSGAAPSSSSGGMPPGSGTTSPDGSLSIISLTATLFELTDETPATTFIAIVTAIGGLDTIAGGQLMDTEGSTYAAFGAGADKGTYTATLDWAAVNAVRGLDVPPAGGVRTFVGKFFDNEGHVATANVEVTFKCSNPWNTNTTSTYGAVDGACMDFSYYKTCDGTTNCGEEGVCKVGSGCEPGIEACFDGKKRYNRSEYHDSCLDFCAANSGTCIAVYVGCKFDSPPTPSTGSFGCADPFPTTPSSSSSHCVCAVP